MKSSLKKLVLILAIISSTAIYDRAKTYWLTNIVSGKLKPAIKRGRRVATTFQLMYRGNQYTMTNKHVCDMRDNIKTTTDIRNAIGLYIRVGLYNRKIINIDEKHDLCLLEGLPWQDSFSLASSYDIGEPIYLVGYPRGLPITIREGHIIARFHDFFPWLVTKKRVPYIMVSAINYPGSSGSPVVNRYGNVVGVLFAGQIDIHTDGYAVPLDSINDFLRRSIK